MNEIVLEIIILLVLDAIDQIERLLSFYTTNLLLVKVLVNQHKVPPIKNWLLRDVNVHS